MVSRAIERTSSRRSGPQRRSQGHDALTVLRDDHRQVERIFKRFEKQGPRAFKAKRELAEQITAQLCQHVAIEEEVLYPSARREVPESASQVLEALEEHHVVEWQLQELSTLDPTDERFTAKMTVIIENVRQHVKEEEHELFPLLRSQIPRRRRLEMGDELEAARHQAPTRPQPRTSKASTAGTPARAGARG